MTVVRFRIDSSGRFILGFRAEGHSGFAPKGEDIVCAGVSALTQTAIAALEKVAGVKPFVTANAQKALLECGLPENLPEPAGSSAQVILATLRVGLVEMAKQYPEFIQVFIEEV